MLPNKSTNAWFAFIASGVKRGSVLRKSVLSSFVFSYFQITVSKFTRFHFLCLYLRLNHSGVTEHQVQRT
jgi:hypothetical protein